MKRTYVDANVLLRFLVGDPPDLAEEARRLFDAVERGDVVLVVDTIIVAEVVWVLRSFYRYGSQEVSRVLQELIGDDGVECEEKPQILAALDLFASRNVDFADALVAVHMLHNHVAEIVSFDHHFDRLPGIVRRAPADLVA